MQPAAHYNAAIEILAEVLGGVPAEKALLSWSRNSRFAGSKDRASIRDIVFDCLRKRSSFAARFGLTARGLALGRAREHNELALFDGENYAPEPLSAKERDEAEFEIVFQSLAEEYDFPTFLEAQLVAQYGEALPALMTSLRDRAPVDLRVNLTKTTIAEAESFLARDHIFTEKLQLSSALRISHNPRRLAQSRAYNYGYVELQDYSSQIVSRFAGAKPGMKLLDYCAGGGGKSLALMMDMQNRGQVDAWDIASTRMKEIPERAARAGAKIKILSDVPHDNDYDVVFIDAPCSGTGAWRRTPDAKWRLNEQKLNDLVKIQADILASASQNLRAGGVMIYATCSILAVENQEQIQKFLAQSGFEFDAEINLNPLNAGDGFYAARLIKN